MVARLQYDQERDVRGELDASLDVINWPTPARAAAVERTRKVEIDGEEFTAPPWWRGDEEASQTFLQAMGVNLDG